MPCITLLSDWGLKDHYLGAVKGSIIRHLPDCCIVDISHQIPSHDILQGSFVFSQAFHCFPEGSIHIICLNTESSIETPHILVKYKGHYLIGADNGFFSLICRENPELIIELEIPQDSDYYTFSERDVFAKVAVMLVKGEDPVSLGIKRDNLYERSHFQPVTENDLIKGSVIYIDSYENAITNIDEKTFKELLKGRDFKIRFRATSYDISEISKAYSDVPPGEKLALFGSSGLLELAINKGRASSLLGLKLHDMVCVEFI